MRYFFIFIGCVLVNYSFAAEIPQTNQEVEQKLEEEEQFWLDRQIAATLQELVFGGELREKSTPGTKEFQVASEKVAFWAEQMKSLLLSAIGLGDVQNVQEILDIFGDLEAIPNPATGQTMLTGIAILEYALEHLIDTTIMIQTHGTQPDARGQMRKDHIKVIQLLLHRLKVQNISLKSLSRELLKRAIATGSFELIKFFLSETNLFVVTKEDIPLVEYAIESLLRPADVLSASFQASAHHQKQRAAVINALALIVARKRGIPVEHLLTTYNSLLHEELQRGNTIAIEIILKYGAPLLTLALNNETLFESLVGLNLPSLRNYVNRASAYMANQEFLQAFPRRDYQPAQAAVVQSAASSSSRKPKKRVHFQEDVQANLTNSATLYAAPTPERLSQVSALLVEYS